MLVLERIRNKKCGLKEYLKSQTAFVTAKKIFKHYGKKRT